MALLSVQIFVSIDVANAIDFADLKLNPSAGAAHLEQTMDCSVTATRDGDPGSLRSCWANCLRSCPEACRIHVPAGSFPLLHEPLESPANCSVSILGPKAGNATVHGNVAGGAPQFIVQRGDETQHVLLISDLGIQGFSGGALALQGSTDGHIM